MILGLIIFLLWLFFMAKNNVLRAAIVLFFLFWQGVPAYNIWQADKRVDELCAKDGGIKVYETVTLPKERFNQWGRFHVDGKGSAKPNDEYYTILKIKSIQGRYESSDIASLAIYQDHLTLYRARDRKILGESISYSRRGGDALGPWMPSSYSCPSWLQNDDLIKKTFLKSEN